MTSALEQRLQEAADDAWAMLDDPSITYQNILNVLSDSEVELLIDSLNDVTDTLSETVPLCKVRKLAYSTFSIAQCFLNGDTHITEFENPPTFFISDGKLQHLNCMQLQFEELLCT